MLNKIAILAIASTALVAVPAHAQEEPVLNVYNWSDYIAEDTLDKFTAETGISVNYDVYDANELVEAKLLAGNSGYDIVVPSATPFLARQIQADLIQKLDKSKLSNLGNMDPELMKRAHNADPGNEHAVIYMWGTTGLGYNKAMIEERMPDAPIDSFDMIFNPEIVSKFADCGVSLLDAPAGEVVPVALNYLGFDHASEDPEHLAAVEELLMSIRPYIRYFHSSQYISDLANGDVCLSLGCSGDILQARDRADEADNGIEVGYSIPKEGAVIWFDMLAIPADAPHPDNAHKFINFIMQPQISADISNYVWYASANKAAYDLVDEEVRTDPGIYPPEEITANLFATTTYSPRFDRMINRMWTKVKTGQ